MVQHQCLVGPISIHPYPSNFGKNPALKHQQMYGDGLCHALMLDHGSIALRQEMRDLLSISMAMVWEFYNFGGFWFPPSPKPTNQAVHEVSRPNSLLSPPVLMHGGLLCVAFCPSVCAQILEKESLEKNSYLRNRLTYGRQVFCGDGGGPYLSCV